MIEVGGDSHCLLYGFATRLGSEGILGTDVNQTCECPQKEVRENGEFYDKLLEDSTYILHGIDAYISDRQYTCNTDSGDILLSALCNAFKERAVVIRSLSDDRNDPKSQVT